MKKILFIIMCVLLGLSVSGLAAAAPIKGDMDLNDAVEISDVILVLRIAIGLDDFDELDGILAIIDEARLWGIARTSAEINQCMNQELSLTGPCSYASDDVIAYFPFSEGAGTVTNEWSGLGSAHKESLSQYSIDSWSGGWFNHD